MALLEVTLLQELGIRLVGYRVPIPLYLSVRNVCPDTNVIGPQVVSRQELAALLLQIEDHARFIRYISEEKS